MATTWTQPGQFIAKAACTTGTESAPTGTSAGLDLTLGGGLRSLVVVVEANDGVTNLSAGSVLQYYLYNPITAAWVRGNVSADLVLVGGAVRETFPANSVVPFGIAAYVPSGLGTAVNVYIVGGGAEFSPTARTSIAVTQATATSLNVTAAQPTASLLNAQVVGEIAHDAADSGNPIKLGGRAVDPTSMPTAVGANDRTQAYFDLNGRLITYMGSLLFGEDSTNNLLAVATKPLAVSTYSCDTDISAALEASSVSKASAGTFHGAFVTNTNAAARHFQVLNSATLPADATPSVISYQIPAGESRWVLPPPGGHHCTAGIVWCTSTSAGLKTIGTADMYVTLYYK